MKIGFTGTRNGMTPDQREGFSTIMLRLLPDGFHHGACVGADEGAAVAVSFWSFPCRVVAHPGVSAGGEVNVFLSSKAVGVSDDVRPTKTHFARNRDIVDETDCLIACPPCNPLPASGGTVYTVNYARKVGKPVYIIWPNGTVTHP